MPPQEPVKSSKNLITLIVVFVILIILVFMILRSAKPTTEQEQGQPQVTKENVQFEQVDLETAKIEADKLPKGFPKDIPVETKDVFISDTKVYTDRNPNVTLYTVNYRTDKSVLAKYSEYLNFMTKAGYTFDSKGKDEKNHSLYGTKGTNSLLVVASLQDSKTVVQIVYTEVK